jgi:hypothetical protein
MDHDSAPGVASQTLGEFARVMENRASLSLRLSEWSAEGNPSALHQPGPPGRLNLSHDDAKNGLGRLVLTLVKLLHELLERQAIHRIESGSLTEAEIERLGVTLMRQAEELDRLRRAFSLEEEDLNIDLGPLGKLV